FTTTKWVFTRKMLMRKQQRVRSAAAVVVEAIERRTLLSATFANGTLTVNGTNNADTIRVDLSAGSDQGLIDAKVNVNGTVLHITNGGLSVLNGGDGNDSVLADLTGRGEQQITMVGGNGNDTFSTTDVDDHATIFGGAGNDTYQIDTSSTPIPFVIALDGEQ